MLFEIQKLSFVQMYLKMLSEKLWPFHLGLNVLYSAGCGMLLYFTQGSCMWMKKDVKM